MYSLQHHLSQQTLTDTLIQATLSIPNFRFVHINSIFVNVLTKIGIVLKLFIYLIIVISF